MDLERLLSSSGLTELSNLKHLVMNALTFSTRIPPLAVHFPALQSTYLCRSSFASFTVPRLTTLTLEHHPRVLTPHSLHDLLDSCTELTRLSFIKCELGVLRGSLPTSRTKLDHLRTLELIECEVKQGQGWVLISDLFMHQTSLPPSASVRVVLCESTRPIFNDAIESIRFCSETTSRQPFNPSDTLIIHSNSLDFVRRSPQCSVDDDTWFHSALPGTERCATVEFSVSHAVHLAAIATCRLPDAQLRSITVLSLHWDDDGKVIMMPNISSLFVKLVCLRTLRVQARLIYHDILCDLESSESSYGYGRWLPNMPHLEHLWLDGKCYKGNVRHATEDLRSLSKVIREHRYTELGSGSLVSPRVLYLQDFGTNLPDDACIEKFRDMGIEVIMATNTAY
ncbi:hypothetical protein PENSPDRAFT_666705 [Peniophora sp. CONT]|nr:hypothetical protein PENSPDRAFT_666705 [Peniophora sp. CONT]